MYSPWLPPEHSNGGNTGLQGAISPVSGLPRGAARRSPPSFARRASPGCPWASTSSRRRCSARWRAGSDVRRRAAADARRPGDQEPDEIMLLNQAAATVDGVYQDITEALKPGVRENEMVALATRRLIEMGPEHVEPIQRDRRRALQPAPSHVHRPASDPVTRPSSTSSTPTTATDLLLPHRSPWVGDGRAPTTPTPRRGVDGPRHRPGSRPDGTDEVAALPPAAEEFGFGSEMEAFGLQFAHGLGPRAARAPPIITRLNSIEGAGRAPGRHGLRAGDLLPGHRRRLRRADRGGDRDHRGRPEGDDALPRAGAVRHQPLPTCFPRRPPRERLSPST